MIKKYKVVLVCMDEFVNEIYQEKFKETEIDFTAISHTDNSFVDQMAKLMPDLILMGIIMKDLDGHELTEMLKADSRTKSIRIIGFSNMSQKEDIEKSLQVGMEDYWISSNYAPSEFVEKVESSLKK